MATAESRGWGLGWPNCQRDTIDWVEAGGIRLLVRKEIKPIVQGFVNEIVGRGYPVVQVADDWGYACRAVRGTKYPSNHSWGLAIDINATKNPQSTRLVTDMPPWVAEVAAKWGFAWGGNYQTRPDAMHFEFMGSPRDVRRILDSKRPTSLPSTALVYRGNLWTELKDLENMMPQTITDGCAVPDSPGTWRCSARGEILSLQDAPPLKGVEELTLNAPVVGIVPYSNAGAWLIGADGGIFACGNAPAQSAYLSIVGHIVGANRDSDGSLVLIASEGHAYSYHDGF